MYIPSDDTFLLADCVREYNGRWALEIGIGTGLLLNVLEKSFTNVAGSDIELRALEHCRGRSRAMLVCCDAASAFVGGFDLIVSNPPYLPDDNEIKDNTVHGGPAGIETTIHFIQSALPLLVRDGKMLLVVSSLSDSSALDQLLLEKKMHKKVVKEKKLFYETLSVIELSI
ncbi:MAG TPA: methyltransferase [Nitrososphaera sp.]|jgi:release factor glutamine methyltransferase|nr:methyltransferase [Nitrososphaera sp.]